MTNYNKDNTNTYNRLLFREGTNYDLNKDTWVSVKKINQIIALLVSGQKIVQMDMMCQYIAAGRLQKLGTQLLQEKNQVKYCQN